MKKSILAFSAAALVLGAAPAYAQFNPGSVWDGPSVGVNLGYGVGVIETTKNTTTTDGTSPAFPAVGGTYNGPDRQFDLEGWQAGISLGYDMQNGSVVYGIVGDYQITNIKGDDAFLGSPVGPQYGIETELSGFGTLRGRVGYDMAPFLPYLTGGIALGHGKATLGITGGTPGNSTSATYRGSDDATFVGYAVGAGVEVAIDRNVSFKAEALHLGLGDQKFDFEPQPGGTLNASSSANLSTQVVRAGLSFRF